MKNNRIFTGVALILFALLMMGTAVGVIPDIPWFKIIVSCVFIGWTVKGLVERDFLSAFLCICVPAWLFEDVLGIEKIAPFPLFLAAALCGIGLNMIVGKKEKIISFQYKDGEEWKEGNLDDVRKEEWQDGRHVTLENNFNSVSKYVNAAAFSSARLENNFGAANIYFNNATIANGEANIKLQNNFGQMNIYIPSTWRANVAQQSAFGAINVFGEPNRDMDAPLVIIHADCNFGSLNIYFD